MQSQQNNPFQSQPKKKPLNPPANFVEALKSIGGQTAKSLTQDVLGGTAKDFMSTFIGGNPQGEMPQMPDQFNPEWFKKREQQLREEAEKRARHKEIIQTPVFDRRQEEVKAQIKQLQEQLQLLAKDLANVGSGVQKAIQEEIANPGTYHLTFFEKLKNFIIMMRKQVNESGNWMEMSAARKQSQQGHFWGQTKKSGTKFSMSHERSVAISTG